MRVKICGLTRAEDAQLAQDLGAAMLGFIFYHGSKRFITPDAAAVIVPKMTAMTVGVFVNQSDDVAAIAAKTGLSGVQLHGDETPQMVEKIRKIFPGLVIRALRPEKPADLDAIKDYQGLADMILIDAAAPGQYGGTGHTGDWGLAVQAKDYGIPVILAGGLNPQNISDAAKAVQPYALDLSSGVEASPGIKDPEKLKALFCALQGVPA
ncbi:MAG: phosphoribosylanthranilate isomerase [Micavibrio sp.]|nr:phosphoribosylanthranilate isomerase [Micavibrio sp.]